jgi:glycolate oxidase
VADDLLELAAELPDGRVITDPDIVDSYARDEAAAVVPPGRARGAVLARTADEVAATLRWASRHRVPVVPRGGGTGLAGGAAATDGCVIVSLARMNAIVEIDPDNELAVAEPGVLNADLDRAAAAHGLMYPPDPSSYEISTIGGNLATNAGGLRCVKYGVTRDSVLGLEVVLADGRILRTGRRTIKGVAGYDLTSLFVGSEGTLGVITSATLRLRPRPAQPPATLAASFPSFAAAARAVTDIVTARLQPRPTATTRRAGWTSCGRRAWSRARCSPTCRATTPSPSSSWTSAGWHTGPPSGSGPRWSRTCACRAPSSRTWSSASSGPPAGTAS